MYFLSSEILKQVIYYFSFIIVIIFGSYCVMFFDMQKHETTMKDNEVFNNFLQSSSPSSGKRRCCKDGRNNFSLVFEATVCYRKRGHICRQNEWLSDGNNRIPILIQFLPDVHCVTSSLFWSTREDDDKFPDGAWKNRAFFKEISHKVWSAHHEKPKGKLFSLKGSILPCESASYAQYIGRCFLFSSCRYTTKDDKYRNNFVVASQEWY